MALQGYRATIKEQSSSVPFTDEATTTSDNITYQITDTNKKIWAYDSTIVVEDATIPTTESYTLNRLDGSVTFESADAGRVITVTGDYVLLTTVAEAREYSFEAERETLDATFFQDASRQHKVGLLSASATIGKFYTTDNYFIEMLLNGTTKVVEFYADATTDADFRVFANVSSDTVSSAVESLTDESISLQVTDRMVSEV